jgi:TolA-binding protein
MMEMNTEPRGVDAVAEFVRTAAPPMTTAQRVEGLQALTFRLAQRRRAGRRSAWVAVVAAGAAAVGAVLLWRGAHHAMTADGDALAYRIEGGVIGDGGYVRSFGADGPVLRFSEGTSMRLMPGGRGRLGRVDGHGARFAIEQGEAEVKVTPRPGARWLVDAGPFLITVRGTVFHASWDGASEKLDVAMTKGLVTVTGPVAEGAVAVRGGQRLTVNVRTKEVLLRELGDSGVTATPSEGPPPATAVAASSPAVAGPAAQAAGASGARARARTSGASSGASSESWASALNAGDFDGILQDAERRGLGASLARTPATELAALADAARYRRRDDVARRALLAERARFPRSARARDAAFLLGRLEETSESASRSGGVRALEWYDRYLQEAPLGAYASEALGRKMTAMARLQGRRAAHEVAATYLRRFPNGSYAATARGLLDAP